MAGTIPAARQHLIDATAERARGHRSVCRRRRSSPSSIRVLPRRRRGRPAGGGRRDARHGGDQPPRVRPQAAPWPADRADLESRRGARRLVDPAHGRRGGHRRHAVPRRLAGHGAERQRPLDPADGAPRAARAAGRARTDERLEDDVRGARRILAAHRGAIASASPNGLPRSRRRILTILDDVRVAVADWPQMRARATELAVDLSAGMPGAPRAEDAEAGAFLEWLADNHFTFLGYREYRLERGRPSDRLVRVPGTGLGLLRTGGKRPRPRPTVLTGEIRGARASLRC